MRVLAVIPCRKGSKGIPGKNFRMLAGKPLWQWTLDAARESDIFDGIVISSDGGFAGQSVSTGWVNATKWIHFDNERPDEYSTDEAQLEPLLLYYAKIYDADVVCLLQPTSPLRTSSDIREAYSIFIDDRDSVVSVTCVGDKYWLKPYGDIGEKIPLYNPEARLNRQDPRTNKLFYENGAIYFCKRWLLEEGKRIGGKIGFYNMSQQNSHQIDTEFDFKVCECALS